MVVNAKPGGKWLVGVCPVETVTAATPPILNSRVCYVARGNTSPTKPHDDR